MDAVKAFLIENKFIILTSVLIIFSSLVFNYFCIKDMQSLPSPLYGGDLYYQLGSVNHVKDGGNPFVSSTANGEIPAYLPLYSILVGGVAILFGLKGITTMFLMSYVFVAIAVFVIFITVYILFKNILLGMLTSLYFMSILPLPILKYSSFGTYLILPLFLFFFYRFLSDNSIKNSVFLGICYGLTGITHGMEFIISSLLLGISFIYVELFLKFIKNRATFDIIKKKLISYGLIVIIGFFIALLWWYRPIFEFHGVVDPFYMDSNYVSFSFGNQLAFFIDFIKNIFLNFNSLSGGIASIFCILSFLGLIFIKTQHKGIGFVKLIFLSSLIILFHYFITKNLFDFIIPPHQLSGHLLISAITLFFAYGMYILFFIIKKDLFLKILKFTLFFLLVSAVFLNYERIHADKWHDAGKNPMSQHLLDLNEYMTETGSVYDTVITTKELGFALNAITGRKLVSFRRGHSPPFVSTDLDTRELDQTIFLYGNNTAVKKEIIKKYDIKYLYWDNYWMQSEYHFDNNGKMTSWFDPLILYYSEEKERILKQNGVKYFVETTWVDPATKGEGIPTHKLIFISPENYYDINHPWNPNIDFFLKEVWRFGSPDMKTALLYKISI